MARGSAPIVFVACLWALLAVLPASALGEARVGRGQPCSAGAECRDGLACVGGTCRAAGEAAPPQGGARQRWAAFELSGTHAFAGVTFAPGVTGYWPYGGGVAVDAGFLFAVRGGVLFDRTELALEIAPVTWLWDFDAKPMLTLNVSIGGLVQVAGHVFWPLRFGLGFAAVNSPTEDVYMEGRLDLIGLAYQYGHLLFELSLPSVRYHTEFLQLGIWAWLFNISVAYVI